MLEVQFNEKSRWLSLGGACRLLDVSQATLRQWADGGHLRVYRTPGGHRRFLREDVDAFTEQGATGRPLPPASQEQSVPQELEGSALRLIRRKLHQPAIVDQPWHRSVDDEGRLRMRLFGRRLLTLLAEEPPTKTHRQEAHSEACLLGRQYGAEMGEKTVGLKDTVEAFIFFRTMVLDSASSNSWGRILELADRVLVGITESFQERNVGTSPIGQSFGATSAIKNAEEERTGD